MNSLIKTDDQQLKLFGSDQMDPALFSAEESGPTPEFTGARLFSAKPETYRAIVALSAEGLSIRRIGRILHVSPNTVLAVRAHEPETIDADKRRLASLSREGARMCVEGIIEMLCDPDQVKKMTIKDKGIVFGILSEKSELLSGSPTARLQTIGAPPAVEVVEYLNWLRGEYARRTGLREEKKEEKGLEAGVAPARALGVGGVERAENGGYQDQGQAEIVEPGTTGGVDPSGNQRQDVDLAPEGSVGQTPHLPDETPVNIESNDGAGLERGTGKVEEVATL